MKSLLLGKFVDPRQTDFSQLLNVHEDGSRHQSRRRRVPAYDGQMQPAPPILHAIARPISVPEFIDALKATCKPRFPEVRGVLHRHVGLAVSGGVDSMALAYLCSKIRRFDPDLKITDNPVGGFRAFVVDHGLREGSSEEAESVAKALRKMDISGEVIPINWKKELGDGIDPKQLSNMESVARRARYRILGKMTAFRQMATLLLAHHEDDQYETVLMRLINGHRSRGLRGMRRVADIPECEGMFGCYLSGWVDDQNRKRPFYNTLPNQRARRYMRQELRDSINQLMDDDEERPGPLPADFDDYDVMDSFNSIYSGNFGMTSMPIEDGGVSIYRPLLEFSKDRLIATCVQNKIPWWEDYTNQDPTLTTRNAIRYLYRNFELPVALQKPAILALSENAEQRANVQEAEAVRLLEQTIIYDFIPQVGSLIVQFPEIDIARRGRRDQAHQRYRRRVSQKRVVAGLLIQRLIELVSPETQTPPLANLSNVISNLFPCLAGSRKSVTPPKAFPIAGLHFMPIESTPQSVTATVPAHPRTWYISRLPYQTNIPLPTYRIPYWSLGRPSRRMHISKWLRWKWSSWLPWYLWDGRYWIRMTHRLPYRVVVMPFVSEHAKHFRESLPPDDRNRLNSVLKKFAPGKVRYTLPAIYSEEHIDLHHVSEEAKAKTIKREPDGGLPPIDTSKMRLLALPTLDIGLPELEKWLLYEVRYKRADRATLETAGSLSSAFVGVKDVRRVGNLDYMQVRRRKGGI